MYEPFGRPKAAGKLLLNRHKEELLYVPFGFTGEAHDFYNGLIYLRARYYDPEVGSFISRDSYPGNLMRPLSQNRYIYVENNPINYIDPSGHIPLLAITMAAGALTGAVISGTVAAVTEYVTTGQINWKNVGVAAAGGAITGAMAGTGLGLTGMVIGNAAVTAGVYTATELLNDRSPTAGGMVISGALGAFAGIIGGKGAYPAIKEAIDEIRPVIPYVEGNVIKGFITKSQDVIQHLYKPALVETIIKHMGSNIARTSVGNIITNAPQIINNVNILNDNRKGLCNTL
jgi:RHS repeat-associated protein